MRHPLIAAALLAAGAGCDRVPAGAFTRCDQGAVVPAKVATDILFVVDDSGSMAAEQAALATAFQAFIDQLAASPIQNDFQVGITTTSVDWPRCTPDGSGRCVPSQVVTSYASGAPYPAGALVSAAGRPRILRAGSPTLVQDFVASVAVGTGGSPKEQGLRALRLALSDRIADGKNAGFLRPGARLAVILVSDEDDCSEMGAPAVLYDTSRGDSCHADAERALLPPVSDFAAFLAGPVGGEIRPTLVAALIGVDPVTKRPAQPSCNSLGFPGYRYRAFLDGVPASTLADDVCNPDFGPAFAAIAARLDPGQEMPLDGVPADWRLLQVSVQKAGGATVPCAVDVRGPPQDVQVLYQAPRAPGRPATLTFQGTCALARGDSVQIRVLCAG